MKTCSKCGEEKALTEFHKRRGQCKVCIAADHKVWREANKEKLKADAKAYREANREKVLACQRAHYKANKEKLRAAHKAWRKANPEKAKASARAWKDANPERNKTNALRRTYGITLDDYTRMLEAQDGKCAVCNCETKLDVDHCHDTGEVRGLLCGPCNRGTKLTDNPELLLRKVEYLTNPPARQVLAA